MKTEEDEAFEAIERRQGGFQAKRQMAADKVQEPAQEQRPWVGLTDEEIEELFQSAAGADEETHIRFARAIQTKLRSINNG